MISKEMPGPNSEFSEKHNVKWDLDTVKILLQVCMDEIRKTGKPGISFGTRRWEVVVKDFNTRANKNYTRKQLKNRLDRLRTEWTLWKQLKGKETNCNHEIGAIEADATWWEAKIKDNPKYDRFRYQGLEHADELKFIFGDTVATSHNAWTQAMGVPIEDSAKYANLTPQEDSVGSNDEESSSDEDSVDTETARNLERTLERLCEAAERHSVARRAEISLSSDSTVQYSIPQCIQALKSLRNEVRLSADEFYFALELMSKEENRIIFISLEDSSDRVSWILFKHNLWKDSGGSI